MKTFSGVGLEVRNVRITPKHPRLLQYMGIGSHLSTSCGHGIMWKEKFRSHLAHALQEVWVKRHCLKRYPGDLRNMFIDEAEMAGCYKKID